MFFPHDFFFRQLPPAWDCAVCVLLCGLEPYLDLRRVTAVQLGALPFTSAAKEEQKKTQKRDSRCGEQALLCLPLL